MTPLRWRTWRTCSCRAVPSYVHASGVLADSLVQRLSSEQVRLVLSPRLRYAAADVVGQVQVQGFVLFSSIASAFGNVGQANYSAANSYLDTFARYRQSRALVASSLQLSLVKGSGMADSVARQDGMITLSMDEYACCLHSLITKAALGVSGTSLLPLTPAGLGNITSLQTPSVRDLASEAVPKESLEEEEEDVAVAQLVDVESMVLQAVQALAGNRWRHVGRAAAGGIDSLVTELSSRLRS